MGSAALDGMSLAEAREQRILQAKLRSEEEVGEMLDLVGLTREKCLELKIDPVEREQLKGIIARLRKLPHPFTTCMRDLRKHKPEWTEDRRKRTCASLKQAAGRGEGGKTNAAMTMSEYTTCVEVTENMARLLEAADPVALETISEFGTLAYKQRKSLPKTAFVFPAKAPGGGSYPIHDLAHARNALARAAGKPEEAAVKKAVYAKFPQLNPSKKKGSS